MIIYGGTPEQIMQQKIGEHAWHGPCMDTESRYFKCVQCFCLDRDLTEPPGYVAPKPTQDRRPAILFCWAVTLIAIVCLVSVLLSQ